MSLLEIEGLRKGFPVPGEPGRRQDVLHVPSFRLDAGEEVALAGTSGSGKTTFLNIVAGIQRADEGRVLFDGEDLTQLSEARRDALRARAIGYVFQSFHLLEGYSALENVLLGMLFGPGADRDRARELLVRLGLGERLEHRPSQLSIGQQQRVAVARALANRPRLVLADEPTGNLDPSRTDEALQLLRDACREQGAALLVVSHDPRVLERFERSLAFETLNQVHAANREAAS